MPKPKILIDTNVWISALLNPFGFPAKIKNAWIHDEFEVIISLPILEEIADVFQRPRIKDKYKLSDKEIEKFLKLIHERSSPIALTKNIKICHDPDDNLVLETAIVGKAEYLVTRDDDIKRDADLIKAMKDKGVEVLTISQFLRHLGGSPYR